VLNQSYQKTIIITGAGTGIGRATAKKFLSNGFNVGLIGRTKEKLEETAEGNKNAMILQCDVSNPDEVELSFSQALSSWGRIDILFNNAGISSFSSTIDETPIQTWLDSVSINLTGTFLCSRAAFKAMRAQTPQGGRIINNGSISAHSPRPGSSPYTSTKHAITGLTKSLSLDGRNFNICASQIDIGNALTEMAESMTTGMPQPDGSVRAEATMDVEHVASSVFHIANLPLSANVQFMTVMATKMPFIGRG
jgi:NAD(P)-dependent dehydrogenase (short-subunit alcohol dehydrogenase family)